MYIYELAKPMHKLETKSLLTPIFNHFKPLKIATRTNIRSKERGNLKIPLFKSAKTQKSVKYQEIKLWNSLLNFKKLPYKKFI